ncbi:zeta toxin family protein [Actinopolymorpha pittospori]
MSGDERPIVVAICGGSASGKSTLASAIAEGTSDLRPVVLEQDWYFRDFAEYDAAQREQVVTANHPDAVLWPAFHEALRTLVDGKAVQVPAPGTRTHGRRPTQTLGPGRLLIVAGLFTFWDGHSRELADLRVFTEVSEDERVLRRVSRDVVERGGSLERVVSWYRRDVAPNYPTYTAAFRSCADLVVPTGHDVSVAVAAICAALRALAHQPAGRGHPGS